MRKEDYRLWCYIWCTLSITFIFVSWAFASAFDDLKEKGICPQGYTCEKIPEINCYKHVLVEEIKGNIATKTNVTYLMNGDVRKGFVWSSNYPVENIIFTFENGTRIPRCDEVVG